MLEQKARSCSLGIPCTSARRALTVFPAAALPFLKIFFKQRSHLPSFLKSKRDSHSVLLTGDT